MKLICDACTVILLAKASVLEATARSYDLLVPLAVYKEIIAGKEKKFADAILTERLENEKMINLTQPNNGALVKKLILDFSMAAGEASVITCALEHSDAVATDNRQGRKAAQVYNLPLLGSIEIVIALYKTGKISLDKARSAVDLLQKEGWFDEYLIEKAKEDLTHD